LSISNPMNETPRLYEAIAVEPIPKKGSITTKLSLKPCNFMHISGNFIGNVAG
jgi:hypothetical protein